MNKTSRLLAEKLLNINAVKLQPELPFVWGNGWNSPLYNDNRRILSYPDVRNFVKVEMAKAILEHFSDANVIAAASTGAIAIGAIVADVLGMPFIFLRDTPKDHGLENQIEGNLRPSQRVVMIDDMVSTGSSFVKARDIISSAGGEVLGGVSILDYEFPMAVKRLRENNIDFIPLTNYSIIVETALEREYIRPEDLETLKEWRKDPANWVSN